MRRPPRATRTDTLFPHPALVRSQARRLSLNIPAVDLLDRVGPARFSARLDNAGISRKFPRGAKPNLSLILGGMGARLEDLVGAFASLNRDGIAGHVRYTPGDARIDRRVMSPGAAWIVRPRLQANPPPGERAEPFDRSGRPRVAWNTRSEEHTSELQSLMRISHVLCTS